MARRVSSGPGARGSQSATPGYCRPPLRGSRLGLISRPLMSTQPSPADEQPPDHDLAARAYVFMGAAGLLLLWLALSGRYGTLALLPVLCGAAGLAAFLPP